MKTGLSPSIFETKQHTFNCWAMARRFLTGVDAEPSPRRCRAHRKKSGERFDASSCAETPTSISYNLLSIARRALFNDRNRLHFDQQIWVGQAPHFDCGTGGKGPKVLHTDVNMLEELLNVRHIRGRLHQIVEGCPSRGECGLEVFAHLAELGAHIALPHDIPLLVTPQL